ncbi:hypothetical protein Celaphus_00011017 [Cervus elaphus hippelaphus]|uniref:Uncharacterized protein n=1 Tax=Cervus elaphus hippelaphus TaxID=46360 RepID=A0A212CQB6_CEREH|nr:hypothetical protein Celaphus_00011017 [Cervus elaphus hippelaphus]
MGHRFWERKLAAPLLGGQLVPSQGAAEPRAMPARQRLRTSRPHRDMRPLWEESPTVAVPLGTGRCWTWSRAPRPHCSWTAAPYWTTTATSQCL